MGSSYVYASDSGTHESGNASACVSNPRVY